ncbi:hypothetical protein [Bacteroides nordii]|uniref:hypothetical protein n=1 Tax=Bacteroides nordii TaxID=291645 RepID=UPI002041B791|nr:hypothetical protein [Bacteroides nordii]GFZ38975.1 hypothetical protein BANORC5_10100 [Bacteroides nordii]
MKQKKLHVSFDLDIGLIDGDKIRNPTLKAEIKDCIRQRLWQFCGWVKITNLKINE